MNTDRFRFRAWEPKTSKMIYFDFVNKEPTIAVAGLVLFRDYLLHEEGSTLMQCTGLEDSDGKLIWEGDIVEWVTVERKSPYQIIWRDGAFVIWSEPQGVQAFYVNTSFAKLIKVIGNIYENSELLEGKDD